MIIYKVVIPDYFLFKIAMCVYIPSHTHTHTIAFVILIIFKYIGQYH